MASSRDPKFSVSYMDRKADPRKDFYRYAAGRWIKTHPLPPDKSRYGTFNEVDETNLLRLKRIAKRCSQLSRTSRADSVSALVGDFYRSAMDTRRIEALKFRPIEKMWELAEGIGSAHDAVRVVSQLHRMFIEPLFGTYSGPDEKDSGVYAFYLQQGGLSLPDRDYYLSGTFGKLRRQYLEHIARMFVLKGLTRSRAKDWAKRVLRVETALAKASRTRTELRDSEKNYNREDIASLGSDYPNLSIRKFLDAAGVPAVPYIVVRQPEFLKAVDGLVRGSDLEDLKAYLCWCVLHSSAPYLHAAVERENFDFFNRKVTGQKKPEPRWKRSVRLVDGLLGEALGKLFVDEHFPEEARQRAVILVDDLRSVFTKRLEGLPWMSEQTRQLALEKFQTFRVKIGHPPKFRDYSSVRVDPADLLGNVLRASEFEFDRQAGRVGGPVDRDEWQMSPPTVNAYFEPTMNEIVFPAGILQPPFFDQRAEDAVNYGAIGVVIGHEITHGYDDQGRRYDAKGNLRDWWTPTDKKEFDRRAQGVVKTYSSVQVLPGLHGNGELTLGENIADLGGVSLAYEALQRRLARSKRPGEKDGMTPEQRFFISYAQIWKQVMTVEEVRRRTTIDPHSLGKQRAEIPAMNHPAFDGAFPPKRDEKPAAKVGVW
ncbi:MAG: M13 family metallopeptidase [Nitrososphaerota archaeon]|nr:M13 family metallopeptidase [Nitrososphaerota archaeon]